MFLLSLLPDSFLHWVINLIIILGLVGVSVSAGFKYVIQYIPQLIPYRVALQIVSVILLVIGVYLKGGMAVEDEWRARVKELEGKVAIAEEKAKVANENVKTVFVDKVQVVKQTQVVVQEKIKEVAVNIDSQCKVTTDTVDILNHAAKGVKK